MVCKNCGADLKPGIKYCLECGNYIEDDEYEDEEFSDEYSPAPSSGSSVRRRRKKLNLTTTDYVIYGGLLLVFVGSIIVIIVTLIQDNAQSATPTPTATATETVDRSDKKLNIDDYSVTVPGALDSTVQGSFLYATDNENFKFSFQIKEDDFDLYYDNQATLKDQLINNKYEVLAVHEKTVNDRLFLLYEIQAEGSKKILYLTKINEKYTTFGTIELFDSGDWLEALPQIDTICNSVSFQFE